VGPVPLPGHPLGLDPYIRYRHRVVHASWSSADARWTVEVQRRLADDGPAVTEKLTCGFLYANTGYYRYDEGYTPEFAGRADFTGRVVHPQHWPEDLDPAGQRIVVIGSGATAVTLVPALAAQGAQVTMVQRSPSYVLSVPERDAVADRARRSLPPQLAYQLVRLKNIVASTLAYQLCRRAPEFMTKALLKGVAKALPADYDVATHFTPRYQPWDQRLCFVPDGDLFTAISDGRATVVTGQIDTFTQTGLRLASGQELAADTIVTATGLNLQVLGGMTLDLDGQPVGLAGTVAYRGVLCCGLPNLAVTLGYTNASWTLKADLAARYVCRLLNHMDAQGYAAATPRGPDPSLATAPFLNLAAGYVQRAAGVLPVQVDRRPWQVPHNYALDRVQLGYGRLEHEMDFTRRTAPRLPADAAVA